MIGDYCDVYLTHDSMSVRKAHNSGRNHLRNVVEYYQQIGQEKAQSVIDSITSSYAAEGKAVPNPAMVPPGAFPPPFGFPGHPGQVPPPPFGIPPPGAPGAPGMPPRTYPQGLPQDQRPHPPPPAYPSPNSPAANPLYLWTVLPGGRGMPFPPFPPNASGTPPQGGFPPPLPNMPNMPPGAGNLPPPPPGGFPNFPIPPPGAAGGFPPPMPLQHGAPDPSIPSGPRGSDAYPPPGRGDRW
ncbi:hypothetical protein PEBR_18043 [Penicillium brasilianum]|uniref:U1 small nuclear ribonucleoprotein C n=1 Tax=Penicillium brasilianum TaxID=104259 RepID=A0A1S9RNW9_PENBI|nr:hypothetical protein PEBR_18043 [Penicillium brasilianum]